jgi:hypothetical protein
MPIPPLIQTVPFDVAEWRIDAVYENYPPADCEPGIINPKRRYLYKRSNRKYPDQFWGEIVAYIVGCLLDVHVPPSFAAFHSGEKDCGTLIEWFYEDGKQQYVAGGHYMQRVMPEFDRTKGELHNFHTIQILNKAFFNAGLLPVTWKTWWCEAFLFDALIGNTDRHQDNWGYLFKRSRSNRASISLAPLFDNGTSLGHERFPNRITNWSEADFQRYISKGTHHVKWQREDEHNCGHLQMMANLKDVMPKQIPNLISKLEAFDLDALEAYLELLCRFTLDVSLTQERKNLYIKLIRMRRSRLLDVLQ